MRNNKITEIMNNIDDTAILIGECKIGVNTKILPYCVLENAVIGDDCIIGPHCHIHGNSVIGNGCRIGNFVEINRSKIGDGTKIAHLAYIGDTEIKDKTNIGAGVVVCNYDGKEKHHTIIGSECFIGSNSSIIAPRQIGNNCVVGAGSVVVQDLIDNKFYLARPDAITKDNKNIVKKS